MTHSVRHPLLLCLVGLLLWAASLGPGRAQDRPVALVVGASAYAELSPLPNAANDARALAARLTELGFDVIGGAVINPDAQGFDVALQRFQERLERASWGLFFYAGHAVETDGQYQTGSVDTFLLPVDTPKTADVWRVKTKAIPVRPVIASLQRRVPALVVILDACRESPLPSLKRAGAEPRGLSPMPMSLENSRVTGGDAARGTYVVYATQPQQVAWDRLSGGDRDPNGVLTRVLLRMLAEQPMQPIGRLMEHVRDEVARVAGAAGKTQVPHLDPNMIGSGRVTLAGQPAMAAKQTAASSGDRAGGDIVQPLQLTAVGMTVVTLTSMERQRNRIPPDAKGVLVTEVQPDGSAAEKGVKVGEVILEVQRMEVASTHDVQQRIDAAVKQDRPFGLFLIQNAEGVRYVPLSLRRPIRRPMEADRTSATSNSGSSDLELIYPLKLAGLGMTVATLTAKEREKNRMPPDAKGVLVTEVQPGGSAAERSVNVGDVIVEVQQNEVASIHDVQQRIDAAIKAQRKFVLFLITNGKHFRYVPISLAQSLSGK